MVGDLNTNLDQTEVDYIEEDSRDIYCSSIGGHFTPLSPVMVPLVPGWEDVVHGQVG